MIIKPSWRLELSLLLYPPGYSKVNAPFYCLPKTTRRIMIVCLSHCLLKYTTVLRVRIGNQYIICPFYGNRELIMEIGFLFQIPLCTRVAERTRSINMTLAFNKQLCNSLFVLHTIDGILVIQGYA